MVRIHIIAALSGVLMLIAVTNGDSINEDELARKFENIQVELAGIREQMHWQEEIHKLKLERMEVRFSLIENRQSELLGSGSIHECPLALSAIQQQLSDVLENQKTEREDEYKCSQGNVTEQNSLSAMRITLEDLQEKVEDIVVSESGGDQELDPIEIGRPRDNMTTVHTGLDQVRTMVEGLQEKVDELTASRQQLQQSGRDSVSSKALTSKNETYTDKIKPRYCHDIYIQGGRQDGVYKIYPRWNSNQSVKVWCEFDVGSEIGWTIILARMPTDSPVNFSRGWDDYKAGFGDAQNEYWIGLSLLHEITFNHCYQVLQVSLHSWDYTSRYAQYKDFSIDEEESGFKLTIGRYSGDAADALAFHNGMKFTTKDKDSDPYAPRNCAVLNDVGGFWYKSCYHTNPFGVLRKKGDSEGMRWNKWLSGQNLKKIIFKISPRLPLLI
ncbi:unnamed protein product [Meganyctiphanes norvegica]|uniref:Fibrinogen C-terminal domain-containing protein n=1 Tax=Meganyctiphanes norvegica TaxID=48144 RepID=A0AAV2R6U0_MEGNR